jgi:hypothetical protein
MDATPGILALKNEMANQQGWSAGGYQKHKNIEAMPSKCKAFLAL